MNKGQFALFEVLTLRIARNVWNSILRSVTVNRASKACINGLNEHIDGLRELVGALLESLEESLASRPILRPLEESVFMRQSDYWTIRYQGQTAILKATRGLDCLGYLLRHPMRDVHVSELLATYRPPNAGVARQLVGGRRSCSNRRTPGRRANSRFTGQGRIQAPH